MGATIAEKLALLKEHIEEDGGIIDLNWYDELYYPYYLYFNDGNLNNRSGSLIAFWGLLIESSDESGFPFFTGIEVFDGYRLDKYITELLKHSSAIKEEYPNLFSVIVESLMNLDMRHDFDKIFLKSYSKLCGINYRKNPL
ncbi:hypothetical protein PAECIP111891_07079 [Paenibacillus allorhizoplanae]|uniref:DUF4375 domain-containing protein n=1 Tax=Paenibacillus allorhizoplanae TaxID=2905648 RepID=A0ABM9CZE8_9BACL|nr:hypothetical protein [Paenibacillus allorhizoplanae]CAH1232716.1 hypothetical protein PAECIP111891_07079 [Paenibacillus allorhizoplanae]